MGTMDNGTIRDNVKGEKMWDLLEYVLSQGYSKKMAKEFIQETSNAKPCPHWQERAKFHLDRCGMQQTGLLYLIGKRGLLPETITAFRLGYNPADIWESPSQWGLDDGKKIYLGKGIVIPHAVDNEIYNLKIRLRPEKLIKDKPIKYSSPRESASCLFNADNLEAQKPLILCEGEFDTMILWQHTRDFASVASLNGAGKGIPDHWLTRIMRHKQVFVLYDNDKAGQAGSEKLLSVIGARARLLRVPRGNDVTDFWLAGGDLRNWLQFQLNSTFR